MISKKQLIDLVYRRFLKNLSKDDSMIEIWNDSWYSIYLIQNTFKRKSSINFTETVLDHLDKFSERIYDF